MHTNLLEVSRSEDAQLAETSVKRRRPEASVSLSHHQHIHRSSQIRCVDVIVELATRVHQSSACAPHLPEIVAHSEQALSELKKLVTLLRVRYKVVG